MLISNVAIERRSTVLALMLIILIAVMAAELLLSGMIARERFGSDPISESSELVSSMAGTSSPLGKSLPVTETARSTPEHDHTTQEQQEHAESLAQ